MSYRELAGNDDLKHLYSPSGEIGRRIAAIDRLLALHATKWEHTMMLRSERFALFLVRDEIDRLAHEEVEAARPKPPPDPFLGKLERAGIRPLLARTGARLRAWSGRG